MQKMSPTKTKTHLSYHFEDWEEVSFQNTCKTMYSNSLEHKGLIELWERP